MTEDTIEDAQSTAAQAPLPEPSSPQVRVVLVADPQTLASYGPALRRLAIGLIAEAIDVTVLSLGASRLLSYLPSPPVKLIVDRGDHDPSDRVGRMTTAERIDINGAGWGLLDALLPQRRIGRIAETLAQNRPMLLHALSEHVASATRKLSKILGVPYVVSVLAGEPRPQALSISDSRCRAVLASNSTAVRSLRRHSTTTGSHISFLPIGTHVTDSPCCFAAEREWAALCCRSQLDHGQGLSHLINSVKRLGDMGHDVQLTLSGSGPAEHLLRGHANQLGLAETVHFVPPFEDLIGDSEAYKAAFRGADIFVLPRPTQSWRCELLEAMSVGNAVVVAGQNSDLIVEDKTALVVPYQDERALTEALARLLTNHDFARQLAADAQQHLRRHFLASHMMSRTLKVYHKVLPGRSPVT